MFIIPGIQRGIIFSCLTVLGPRTLNSTRMISTSKYFKIKLSSDDTMRKTQRQLEWMLGEMDFHSKGTFNVVNLQDARAAHFSAAAAPTSLAASTALISSSRLLRVSSSLFSSWLCEEFPRRSVSSPSSCLLSSTSLLSSANYERIIKK